MNNENKSFKEDILSVETEIKNLRLQVEKCNYEYYVLDQPSMTDIEFDCLLKQLDCLEKKYPQFYDSMSPTQRVGGDINKEFKQVAHRYPMLSLSNTYSREEITEFVNRAQQTLGIGDLEWVCELKYDGLAISLLYEKGRLVRAVTRGNGEVGDDVTSNIKTIKSIPLHLQGENYANNFEIRGEIVFPHEAFEEFNRKRIENGEEPFANERNAASGSLKLQDSSLVAQRKLDCYLYYLIGEDVKEDTHAKRLEAARRWGFKIEKYYSVVRGIDGIMEFINHWEKERYNLPFATDGVVIKLNVIKYWSQLGYTAKSPRWATAFKFKAAQAQSKLIKVEYQVGRTGIITPVANFEPVWLGGTWVKRATLNNEQWMEKLDLCDGDTLIIEKGGEIIPKIVECEHDKLKQREGKLERIVFRDTCPECGEKLVKEEEQSGWYCPNYNHCFPQILGRFQHFISKKAMNIESLGGEKIRYLLNDKKITDFISLYTLTEKQIVGLYQIDDNHKLSIQEKGAYNIINAIEKSKEIPFERVLYALGIRYIGEVTAKTLAKYFLNIENLKNATLEELQDVQDIGQTTAKSVFEYLHNEENLKQIEKLKDLGLKFEIDTQEIKNILDGKSFVVSGTFTKFSREELKKAIENNGGKNVSSISTKTDFLIAGQNMGPEKKKKAQMLQINIINEDEFIEMITKSNS